MTPASTETRRLQLRLVWAIMGFTAAGVIALSFALQPDPAGHGTHTQLGLPPCGIRQVFSIPCPSCGMTTAFAAMAHGQWTRALAANGAGAVLFLLTAAAVPVSLLGCWGAWSPVQTLVRWQLHWLLPSWCAAMMILWVVRLFLM